MDHYKEYAVRCLSCGAGIAPKSYQYMEYIDQGYTPETALNTMSVMRPCCRIHFFNPTIVLRNMENRPLIEGFKHINNVEGPDPITVQGNNSVFSACITEGTQASTSTRPSLAMPKSVLPRGKGIAVATTFDISTFELPTTITFPTINRDNTKPIKMIPVGADHECGVLDGRTYLAI